MLAAGAADFDVEVVPQQLLDGVPYGLADRVGGVWRSTLTKRADITFGTEPPHFFCANYFQILFHPKSDRLLG